MLSKTHQLTLFTRGLFAIKKEAWVKFDALDDKMKQWGGENIEISLRTWMCGGRIAFIHCSRVAHHFRKAFPYKVDSGHMLHNTMRAAAIWYVHFNEMALIDPRTSSKYRLQCNLFDEFYNLRFFSKTLPVRFNHEQQALMHQLHQRLIHSLKCHSMD